MPLIGTRGGASAKGFGQFNYLGTTYYIGMMGTGGFTGSYAPYTTATVAYPSGAVGVSGTFQNNTTYGNGQPYYLVSTTPSLSYCTAIQIASNYVGFGYAVLSSNSGKLFVSAGSNSTLPGDGLLNLYLGSYTNSDTSLSSPTYTYYSSFGQSGLFSSGLYKNAFVLDSSDNSYHPGYINYPVNCCVTSRNPGVVKLNSSGTVVWATAFYNSTFSFYYTCCSLDASNNVYVIGGDNYSTTAIALFKFNNAGSSLDYAKKITLTGSTGLYCQGKYYSDGNVYIVNTGNGASEFRLNIITASTGTATAAYSFTATTGSSSADGPNVSIGPDGYIYVLVNIYESASAKPLILAKISRSGVLQWARKMSLSGVTSYQLQTKPSVNLITFDNLGNLCISFDGQRNGAGSFQFVMKLNPDGSGTGSYTFSSFGVNFVYASEAYSTTTLGTPTTANFNASTAATLTGSTTTPAYSQTNISQTSQYKVL